MFVLPLGNSNKRLICLVVLIITIISIKAVVHDTTIIEVEVPSENAMMVGNMDSLIHLVIRTRILVVKTGPVLSHTLLGT